MATFTAVETKIKQYDAMLYKQMEATRDAYQQYSKSVSARGVKRMNFIDFNEAVGMAMRRGDQSDIPEVSAKQPPESAPFSRPQSPYAGTGDPS